MRIPAQVSHGVLLDYLAHIVTLGLLGQVWYGEALLYTEEKTERINMSHYGKGEFGQAKKTNTIHFTKHYTAVYKTLYHTM